MADLRTPDGDIDAFMSDPDISELIERLKTTGDFLDIVTLSEVQHSNMLAWCLDPSEGHGQGDLVLKDFFDRFGECKHGEYAQDAGVL